MRPVKTRIDRISEFVDRHYPPLGLSLVEKGAISYASAHKTCPKADEGAAWDGAAEMAKADTPEQWRRMCAWVDSSAPENKGSYKLPHHRADGAVVLAGVQAAAGALQGARGGVDVPAGDVAGVRTHIAKHYRDDFDREPPWAGA